MRVFSALPFITTHPTNCAQPQHEYRRTATAGQRSLRRYCSTACCMSCKGSTRFNAPALLLVGACRTKCSCCQQSFCNTAFSCLPVPRPLSTPTLGGTHLECLAARSGCSCRCCRRRCSQVRLPAMSATQQQCGHSTAHSTCQNRST